MRRALMGMGLAVACSSEERAAEGGGSADTGYAEDSGGFDSAPAPDDAPEPAFWELGATFTVSDGVASDGVLALEVFEAEAEEALCAEDVQVGRMFQDTSPEESIYRWWRLRPEAPAGACAAYDNPLPTVLYLGVGAMHPEIAAVLGRAGLQGVADRLNGAYASLDEGETVWVYGVAGTADAFGGTAEAATDEALVDGNWTVVPLYPFYY